jgi:hypothetical protein
MSSFLIPKSICSHLDRSFKNLWWGFSSSKSRNLSLKSWNSLCIPKALGGLGLRKMKDVNLALLAKLGWKLLTGANTLWVSQLTGKYLFSSNSFLSPSSISATSWLWKGIIKTKPLISLGACHNIHPHSSLSVWNSSWIPTLPLFSPSPIPHCLSTHPDLKVSDLISSNSQWNFPLLVSIFTSSSVLEILKIPISPNPSPSYLWTPSTNGLFSTSSAHKLICHNRTSSAISPLDTSI